MTALSCAPRFAAAADNLLLYGTEVSRDSAYVYLGTIVPIELDSETLFVRLWSDAQTYEYESGLGVIDAEARSLHLALGRQFIHESGWFNVYLGYGRNNTTLEPNDPGNDSRGRHDQALVSLDGDHAVDGCAHNMNYGVAWLAERNAYWSRIRPVCWSYGDYKTGFELVAHGDPNYRHVQLGGLIYNQLLSAHTDYTLKAGITHTRDSEIFPYLGIEFTTRY